MLQAHTLRQRILRLLAVVLALALGAAGLCLFLRPARYRATVLVQVEHKINPKIFSDPWFIQTEFEVIQCPLILSNAVERLNLSAGPTAKKKDSTQAMSRLQRQMRLRGLKEDVLEISIIDGNREEAASIANVIAETYCDYIDERYRTLLKDASESEKRELEALHGVVRITAPVTGSRTLQGL